MSEPDWLGAVPEFLTFVWRLCYERDASVVGGCRTEERNVLVGGSELSKHTFEAGWGLACDLWFDRVASVEAAKVQIEVAGYGWYQGEGYDARRLHVQCFAYGELPPVLEA